MSDFSRSPLEVLQDSQKKGYVGIHIEQGAALLDRDLNLLHDLVAATARQVVARYIGSGLATGSAGFAIQPLPVDKANAQDFLIAAGDGGTVGRILVGGIEVTIPAPIAYTSQPGVPALTTPTAAQPDPRLDTVYLDVFLTEVDGRTDSDLKNSQDVGMQTSVRIRADWVVRVAEGGPMPSPPDGHAFAPLAQLSRKRGTTGIDGSIIADLRQNRLTVSDIEQRLSLVERMLILPAFAAPPLHEFIPQTGVINQPITIIGRNLDVGQLQVFFGDAPAKIVGAPSPTQVVARVPPNLTPASQAVGVDVTIANEAGSAVSARQFTVLASPAFVDPGGQFSPNHGIAGAQVTLNGFNFNAAAPQVQFGGTAATIIGAPTPNQIVVTVPAGLVPAGSTTADVKVTVTTSAGTTISDDTFRAELPTPAPAFAAPPGHMVPKTGKGGDVITLNGQNFNVAPVSVKFDTTNATLSGAPSATQIAVQVPPNMTAAGTSKQVDVTVTTGGGSVTSPTKFTVTGP